MKKVRLNEAQLRRLVRGMISEVSDETRAAFDTVAQGYQGVASPEELAAVEANLPQLEALTRELVQATHDGDAVAFMEILSRIEELKDSMVRASGRRR